MGWLLTLAIPYCGGAAQLLSSRNAAVAMPAGGNGHSAAPQLSAAGRFVVFSSTASDLVAGDNGFLGLDVFLRDCASNTTTLVSANFNDTGGGNAPSFSGIVSTNGRYVVFQSDAADLVPGDANGSSDIFVRDLLSGTTALVSVATNNGFGDAASTDPVMTPDGRYVAFVSAATNLVANDTNGIPDVFVRDLMAGTTVVATPEAVTGAGMSSLAITPDGRYVAFFSTARGLSTGVSNNSLGEIYVRDLASGTTTWASAEASAIVRSNLNYTLPPVVQHPVISDDGRYIAFKSGWTNGAVTPPNGAKPVVIILRYDKITGLTEMANTNGFPPLARTDDVFGPEMTPNGRFLVFACKEGNTNFTSLYVWDGLFATNIPVSVDASGSLQTNALSCAPAISRDGRFVAFLSNATNLVSGAVSNGFHVYLRDLQSGNTALVDADTNGGSAIDNWGDIPVLSADGRFVAFSAMDGALVAADNNQAYDVFRRDMNAGTTELISRRFPSVPQTGNSLSLSGPSAISADGRWVAYTSWAGDVVTNDFNNEPDVLVSDRTSGSNILVSVGIDGNTALGGNSVTPAISADGRYVAFTSLATNLVTGDTNGAADIFRRDLLTGTTLMASVNPDGSSLSTGDASAPVLSSDGRYLAFLCRTSTAAWSPRTLWHDMVTGTNVVLNSASAIGPSLSADGQRVAYFDSQSYLYVWDASLAANIYTNPVAMSSAALSPAGNRVLFHTAGSKQLSVRELAGGTSLFSCSSAVPVKGASQWSSDGRFFAFVTATNLLPGDANGTNDVYLCDLQSGTLTLVSANSSGTGSANGGSDVPVVSGSGRFVVFRSFATNVVVGVTNAPGLYVFDRFTGMTGMLNTGTRGSGWTSWVFPPSVSSNGAAAVFASWDSTVTGGDFNRAADVLAQAISAVSEADADADGIADWWTTLYFGHPTGQGSDQSLAQQDADGDGMTNLQEYLTGTSPTDPESVFRIQISTVVSGGKVQISWPAVLGKSYRVQYTDDLAHPAWQDCSGNAGVIGRQGSQTVDAPVSGRFYRMICIN